MSTFVTSIKTTLVGYSRYRGREGQYSFLIHRLTGIGTLLFLLVHILDTSTVYFFPHLYEEAIALYQSTPFMLGEIALVFSIIFHGVNGLRIAYLDMFKPEGWAIPSERRSVRSTMIASIILWLPTAVWMARGLLIHNFGLFGG